MTKSPKLETAILNTVRYFDLFDMPLTAVQMWRCLVVNPEGRKEGFDTSTYSLRHIREAVVHMVDLGTLSSRYGFYTLPGREHIIEERFTRHVQAQMKWKILCRLRGILAVVPFVRGLAGSGSLALDHTKPSSDLDLFVIVRHGRIWTARLLLLIVTQLLGRRRKYWNKEAPDKVCLNHYITDESLAMPSEVQNMYTAVQYVLHVPVFNEVLLRRFRVANQGWIGKYVVVPSLPVVSHRYVVELSSFATRLKQEIENLLLEPLGDWFENVAESIQRRVIAQHRSREREGRVVVSQYELAFHPDTKVPALLAKYYQR